MTTPDWRPPRITPAGLDFHGTAPPGHVVVGVLVTEDGTNPIESMWTTVAMPATARSLPVLLAEVLDVGAGCPGVEAGNRVLIQRFSGAGRVFAGMDGSGRPSSGIDPGWFLDHSEALARFSAVQVVRCGNGIRAQEPGIDDALVAVASVVKWRRDYVRDAKGRSPDDPKQLAHITQLAREQALLEHLKARRRGRAVNGAVQAAGLSTGDDGAAFDGVVAVVD